MKAAQSHHGVGRVGHRTQGEKRDAGVVISHRLQDGGAFHVAGSDVKFRMTAQRADQQLRLHAIGIGDKHTDSLRSGGGQTHTDKFSRQR